MTGITRWNKTKTPAGGDGWNLTPNIGTALDTANLIVPVASQTERDALNPPTGQYAGMVVSRTDISGAPLERFDGTKWSVSDVPWTNVPLAQAFTYWTNAGWNGMQYAVRNGWVIVNGAVSRSTAWATDTTCGVIPAAYKPAVKIQGSGGVNVEPTVGNITLPAGSGAVSFSAMWPLF